MAFTSELGKKLRRAIAHGDRAALKEHLDELERLLLQHFPSGVRATPNVWTRTQWWKSLVGVARKKNQEGALQALDEWIERRARVKAALGVYRAQRGMGVPLPLDMLQKIADDLMERPLPWRPNATRPIMVNRAVL